MVGSRSMRTRISPSQPSGTAIAAPKPSRRRVSRMAEGRWESAGCAAGFAINRLLWTAHVLPANGSNVGKISPIVEPSGLVQNNAGAECRTLDLMQAVNRGFAHETFLAHTLCACHCHARASAGQ